MTTTIRAPPFSVCFFSVLTMEANACMVFIQARCFAESRRNCPCSRAYITARLICGTGSVVGNREGRTTGPLIELAFYVKRTGSSSFLLLWFIFYDLSGGNFQYSSQRLPTHNEISDASDVISGRERMRLVAGGHREIARSIGVGRCYMYRFSQSA